MQNAAIRSASSIHSAKLLLGAFILLAAIFFVADHDLYFSIKAEELQDIDGTIGRIAESSLGRFIVFPILGLAGAIGLLRSGINCLRINGVLGWLLVFYIAWASLSLAWSDDAALTLRRVLALWMLCLGALAMVKHFNLRDIILCLFYTTLLYLIIGLAAEIGLGTFRPLTFGYRFSGTLHPNFQGVNCALLLMTGLYTGRVSSKRGRYFFRVCAAAGFVFLIFTGSRTAFAGAIVAFLVSWNFSLSRSRKLGWLLGISIGMCLLILLSDVDFIKASWQSILLGRTGPGAEFSTLSGRIPLWKDCLDYAAKRPFQGYGYSSFFTTVHISKFGASHGWAFTHAHSAYLESLLGTGVIGLVSFVSIFILAIKRAIDRYKNSLNPVHACSIAILVFCALNGVLEATIVHANMLSFIAMINLCNLGFTQLKGHTR